MLQVATPIPDDIGGGFVVPPSRALRTGIAALVGLLLGFALALVLERLDSRLRTRDQVHAALRLPIIAEVPRLTRAQKRKAKVTVAADPLAPYSDAYRVARTALTHTVSRQLSGDYPARRAASPERRAAPTGARLILVTSANASEGKTTSVANLAASFAETGQRVLVLDADLRSPDTHNLFDVPQGAGISDYISDPGDVSLEALVRPTSVPGVRIITAGTRLAHPESLSSRMGHLLTEVRGMADVVLIDSAPLLAAGDVFDVLPIVDTVLLVVRSGRLTDVAARRVAELLGRFQVPISGVVLLGARGRRADGYGYGYGYGGAKKQKRGSCPACRCGRVVSGGCRARREPSADLRGRPGRLAVPVAARQLAGRAAPEPASAPHVALRLASVLSWMSARPWVRGSRHGCRHRRRLRAPVGMGDRAAVVQRLGGPARRAAVRRRERRAAVAGGGA